MAGAYLQTTLCEQEMDDMIMKNGLTPRNKFNALNTKCLTSAVVTLPTRFLGDVSNKRTSKLGTTED